MKILAKRMLRWNLGIVMAIFVVLIGGWGFWQAEPEEWLLEGLFARMVSKVSGEGSGGGLFMALVEWVWRSYGVFAAAKVAAGWGMVEGVFFLLLAGMVGILVDRFLWRGWGWVVLVTVAGVMFVKSVRDEFRWSKFTLKKDKNIEIFKALDALEMAAKKYGDGIWYAPTLERWRFVLSEGREEMSDKRLKSALDAAKHAGDGFLWRRKALEKGIRVAVFAGRREEYLPVLELVRSMGWRLVFANSLGFVYASKRDENGSGNQKKMDYAFLGKKEGDRLEGGESGRFVAMRATQLANAGEGSVAMREFKRARELSPGDRRVRVEFASFLAMRGMWREALGEVEGVLRENQREVAALQVGVQSALALGKRQMAWEWAEKLREEQGWDAFSLYLHARAANAVGAAWAEEDSLRKLIGIMEKRGARVGVYRVFLGQALVQQGLTKEALKEFEAALESGDLAERQEKDVRDWLERLRNF